jgi:acylphosphatase
MKRIRVRVSGIVQGVGFRAFAKHHATNLFLTGYTKNNPDGSVTVEIQGDTDIIAQYLSLMEQGPSHAQVRHIKVEEIEEIDGESIFVVTG